jgi:hypothetical protein
MRCGISCSTNRFPSSMSSQDRLFNALATHFPQFLVNNTFSIPLPSTDLFSAQQSPGVYIHV